MIFAMLKMMTSCLTAATIRTQLRWNGARCVTNIDFRVIYANIIIIIDLHEIISSDLPI